MNARHLTEDLLGWGWGDTQTDVMTIIKDYRGRVLLILFFSFVQGGKRNAVSLSSPPRQPEHNSPIKSVLIAIIRLTECKVTVEFSPAELMTSFSLQSSRLLYYIEQPPLYLVTNQFRCGSCCVLQFTLSPVTRGEPHGRHAPSYIWITFGNLQKVLGRTDNVHFPSRVCGNSDTVS